MKIAILSPFHPYRGGIAQFSTQLYLELKVKNEVKAFSFSSLYPSILFPGKSQFVTEEDSAIQIENEHVLNTINPITYYKTARKIKDYSPDILIIAYWMPFFAPAFGSICRLLGKKTKIVTLVHNALPHERSWIDKSFSKFLFNKSDKFIVLSEPVKKDLLSLKVDANILVTPHPIYNHYGKKTLRTEACEFLKVDVNKKILLFFGFIRDYKGLDILIEAMSDLDESYQLIIAGECYGSFEKYDKLIQDSSHKSNIVVYNQYIDDEMVKALFSVADLLVLPYRSATQSGVAPLAYHFEVPIIATNVGALKETIELPGTGVIVNQIEPKALALGISNYFEKNTTEQYIINIRKEKERLSWKKFCENIIEFIT